MDNANLDKARTDAYRRVQEFDAVAGKRWPFLGCPLECGAGWIPLITEMLDGMAPVVQGTDFRITQVKEKFGGLRVYAYGETPETDALVERAVERAWHTCEISGEEGTLGSEGGYHCVRSPAYRRAGTVPLTRSHLR